MAAAGAGEEVMRDPSTEDRMTESRVAATSQAPAGPGPRQVVASMIQGYELAYAVHAAARLGVADLLADGPRPYSELAEITGARAPLLGRLLRFLASAGVFAEVEPGVFGLTPEAELLREGPGSLRTQALFWVELATLAWRELVGVVRTGRTGYQLATGMSHWEYYAHHPEAGALFDATMTAGSRASVDAIVTAYDFPLTGTVVDIGGGQGTLLAAILAARPKLRGVLVDQPQVVAGAAPILEAAGVASRCDVVGGDIFRDVPGGGNLYVMKLITHGWDDEHAIALLGTCRRAMGGDGTLLVIDQVVPSGTATPSSAHLNAYRMDVNMMVWAGSQERTAEEFATVLGAAGFRLTRIIPTARPISLVEAVPV